MILIVIFVIILLLISVTIYFLLRKAPSTADDTPDSLSRAIDGFFKTKCTPTLDETDAYAATYILDSDNRCVPDTCKPGYTFYYGDPKSVNKFKRCQ